jgi:hypothetical protein
MPDELVAIIASLPIRLRESLKAQTHAAKNYPNATDTDVARDLKVNPQTIRNHRRQLAAVGLPVPPLHDSRRPRKSA